MRIILFLLLIAAAGCAGPRPAASDAARRTEAAAPASDTSARGAANIVRVYFALAGAGRIDEARRLWWDGESADAFVRSFGGPAGIRGQAGAPGAIEGAAGSLYVEVAVKVYTRPNGGGPYARAGTATLRRVNDVPGSTAEQRRWRITIIVLAPPAPPPGGRS